MAKKTKENQQGRIMPLEDFNLVSFSIGDKGLTIEHSIDGGPIPKYPKVPCKGEPHPDFQNLMLELRKYAAIKIGLLEPWNVILDNCDGNLELGQIGADGKAAAIEKVKVTGLSIGGEDELRGVTLKCYLKFSKKGGTGMSIGKIHFEGTEWKFEEELEELIERVRVEVYNYLILSKKAQQEIPEEKPSNQKEMFQEPGLKKA